MIRKILFVLLLGIITVTIILFMKQPAKTITIGEYEAVPHIDVTLDELNMAISNSPDDKIHVQMQGHKLNKNMLTIHEENNTFFMKEQKGKKNWKENIRFRPTATVIVQLPNSQSKTLALNGADGDFTIQDLELDTIQLETSAGVTYLKNLSASNTEIQSEDGNVTIANSAIDHLEITSTAGDVAIKESTGSTHTIQTVDGQIKLTKAAEQPNVHVKSVSGDIGIHYKESPTSLQLLTTGEDVEITLPKYNKKTGNIGDGSNILSAETKDGVIAIK
ncbi:MAG TPA: hypothetical protein DEO65_18400 [Bacillus bacterium]|uniref:DUF4097 family beta strand repeat-containing protein n=1 Tax=Siminovitchia fordii TaxID=254759 RepID=UPI000360D890|nr:DUF4097 family beta strand repeat-containing protein [Siminovitchia fordii]HBZ11808.1 hypothetical protein [Bacillus sp. (in: firmicutes)]